MQTQFSRKTKEFSTATSKLLKIFIWGQKVDQHVQSKQTHLVAKVIWKDRRGKTIKQKQQKLKDHAGWFALGKYICSINCSVLYIVVYEISACIVCMHPPGKILFKCGESSAASLYQTIFCPPLYSNSFNDKNQSP